MGAVSNSVFEVAGGDGGCYGPRFGPVRAECVAQVPSAEGGHLLLRLSAPILVEGVCIEFLAVRPRYVGDSLEDIAMNGGTVGYWRVFPGKVLKVHAGLDATNSEYWSIGTCTRLHAQPSAPADAPPKGVAPLS